MTQHMRVLIAAIVLVALVAAILGIDALRRTTVDEATLAPGSVAIYLDGKLMGGFVPDDLNQLEEVSFTDAEEGKTQQGWLLRDVMLLHVSAKKLKPDSFITVSSTSRNKAVQLTWAKVDDPANKVMFDLSSRGTLKLVSVLERLDTRDEWVQDVDQIDITSP